MSAAMSPRHYPSAAGPLALCCVALVVYVSLFPFTGWRFQGLSPLAFVGAPWPRYWTWFDVLTNLAGYVPLGFLLALALLRRRWGWPAVALSAAAAAALSLVMEGLQTYLPQRVPSNVDWGLNAAGALLGALLAFALERLGAIDRWRRFRARWFVRDSRGALVLLLLWPVGLLFPPPVAFGLGQVRERLTQWLATLAQSREGLGWLSAAHAQPLPPLMPAPELACVALGLLAPCLLGYVVVPHRARRMALALVVVLVGFGVSALSSGLTYGPVHAWVWLGRPALLGMQLALLAAPLLLWLPAQACRVLLLAVLLTQVALLNMTAADAYYAQTLQSWEQGRFIHFHGLAQWVGWLWPFAALAYGASQALAAGLKRREAARRAHT